MSGKIIKFFPWCKTEMILKNRNGKMEIRTLQSRLCNRDFANVSKRDFRRDEIRNSNYTVYWKLYSWRISFMHFSEFISKRKKKHSQKFQTMHYSY